MKPEDVTLEILKEYEIIGYKNGCFPFAFAGMLALQFPDMSKNETLKIVRAVLAPVRNDEQLYRRRKETNYKQPYTKKEGSCAWAHLVYHGFGGDLKWDVNVRLEKLGVPLEFGYLEGYDYQLYEKLLSEGATILPTLSVNKTSGGTGVDGYHTACFHKQDEDSLYYIDANIDKPESVEPGFLENITDGQGIMANVTASGNVLYYGYSKPIAFYFKRKDIGDEDFQITSLR